MADIFYFIAALLLTLLLFIIAYVFIFVRPRKGKIPDTILLTSYAHRGLHSKNTPENSVEAFEKAINEGFGIELDVQLSKDEKVMVFHDYSLFRMTGIDRKLCELKADELCTVKLKGSNQTIPTFREVLELVNGRVPLLVELKGEDLNSDLCEKVAELLNGYTGPYCIESFNPFLVRNIKKYIPNVYCGQLYTNVCRDKKKISALNFILSSMAFNFLAKPDFIAYNKDDRDSLPVKLTTKLHSAPKFVWTLKSEGEVEKAHALGEYPIFERNEK